MKTTYLIFLACGGIAMAEPGYELHEWGTFTTVSGSDGVLLEGLDREEEALPAFVHTHLGLENGQYAVNSQAEITRLIDKYKKFPNFGSGSKGLGKRPVKGVKVKMETPVIYFHAKEGFHAKVKVGFNGGTISQWYPARSGGETLPEPEVEKAGLGALARLDLTKQNTTEAALWTLDFSNGYKGGIEWDVDVLSPEQTAGTLLFKPQDTIGWLRARVPGANAVKTSNGETEGYLFYRGLGNFETGLKTSVSQDETLHVENRTGGKIPYLVAFERLSDGTVRWMEKRDGLEGNLDVKPGDLKVENARFCEPLYRAVQSGLASCGLTQEESKAMVETWWRSYFEAPGLRVFWVLPADKTNGILPLEVSPAPAKTVRVLVGRNEVFRPSDEQQWMKMASDPQYQSTWASLKASHRFGTPIVSRVATLQHQAAK